MSMTKTGAAGAAKGAERILDRKPLLVGVLALTGFVAFLRFYEQLFGWSAGLDSFSPEYQIYWLNLLKAAIALAFAGAGGLFGYLWRTRDRKLAALSPTDEMRRLLYLIQWLVIFALALFWGLSFFTEQTAVWHMTAVRDTDFTPSNIVTFYASYPLFAIIGAGAFLYAKTRLPLFANGYSLAFLVLVVGLFMTIPNVGFNEWGHTSWSMDEGFAGPLHWGFVFFGWMSLGVFGVVLLILGRLRALLGPELVAAFAGR
ncbi:methane monooxygenase/ammonia monooxygenase subunit C [Methylocystis parvus]|uniref:Methane monooxygenase/ammonia monooxygenase subunit C n=1 Tax=Methylocystis parvus TaxID=134 RepID=A0A6B8M1P9_9HYPH|nr:methane monooxygenase/ammonia monooxygenase subunit C [Methylocystis parvus]QGM96791.1 methane monooxygenase/ammonia monooxygenase subunit C [Methylocystis parvus]WBJ99332.1 methane monooxygenase/ammonia monooxygenase subunit C [Methylocystis parvus OBBP]